MSEPTINVHLVVEEKPRAVPYDSNTTAEDICISLCKKLGIGPAARHLFALRITGKKKFLMPGATFTERNANYDLRIRFKVSSVAHLKKLDIKAYDYHFHQARTDVLENKIPDLVYEKCKRELIGLGITDMYRVMLEKDIPRESVENDYKKYIPKEVVKRHSFFIKRPVHDTLVKLQKAGHDAWYVKAEYLKQLDMMVPEYLAEEYKCLTEDDGAICSIAIRVTPASPTPLIKYCFEHRRDHWYSICMIEDLSFVALRKDALMVEISRKNGIPVYLQFSSLPELFSFVSLLDGYYRLCNKWTFNICKDVITPSLQKLYALKCHGPIGGEFSYAKLADKRDNKPGCFILRESELKYNIYYIDVCMKESFKPKTFKLERLPSGDFIFNDDLTRYKTVQQLMAAYNDPNGVIFLQECLLPSEYDKSLLLLCRNDNLPGPSLTDSATLCEMMPSSPMCINSKDLQVYKDRKCLKWTKDRNKVRHNGTLIKIKKFDNYHFPDERAKDAKKYCRNPNGDVGGPWCYVEIEDSEEVEREYCDIPFCDDQDCMVFTQNDSFYSHYTLFNESLTNFTFGVKIWDSDSYLTAYAKLVLSLMALPITGQELDDLGMGIEIYLSNKKSGLTYGNKDREFEESHGILKSTEYTFFSLSWSSGFVSLNKEGKTKPLFLAEYKTKGNLLGFKKDVFKYYSAQGTNILWSFPFCDDDFECDVHTTTSAFFQQFWPLRQTEAGQDLQFHIRAFQSANILLVPSPTVDYPRVKITLRSVDTDNNTKITLVEFAGGPTTVLADLDLPKVLNYWNWHEFSLALFADTFQLYWSKELATHMLVELKNANFRKLRWFSPSSTNAVAHWTFFCEPPRSANPPNAWLPECALSDDEPGYKGTQDVTERGLSCLPWAGQNLIPDHERGLFDDKSLLMAWNYCRDPGKESKGTYCYAISQTTGNRIQKTYCRLRKCKSAECKMAGTGNDYIGKINVTRSNRTCQPWVIANTTNTTTEYVHETELDLLNGTLYADMSAEAAENYCRNPSRNIAGSWCYTTDALIPRDVCNIRDCDMREECIIVTRGHGEGRNVYILPQWKETGVHGGLHFGIKEWDPDLLDGIMFVIKPMHGTSTMKLLIGAENNEKIMLYYNNQLAKEKTFPRLILSGKWTLFWLQLRKGEVMLGFEGVPTALFEWKHEQQPEAFMPMFLSYMSIHGHPIGMFFKCDECHTENTTVKHFTRVMPLGLWSEKEQVFHRNLTLKLRGNGIALIPLMLLPGSKDYYGISIGDFGKVISFIRYHEGVPQILSTSNLHDHILTTTSWTEFHISFSETEINITRNNTPLLHHHQPHPMLFYWFSVGADKGWIAWCANCEPLDIDGPPRDGGWSAWSAWQCTVSCGGGEGVRTRTCSNPHPNIFGLLCEGHKRESSEGITMVYRSMWQLTKAKKVEVAMKILKRENYDRYLKVFLELAGHWGQLRSSAIVRLFGITLTGEISMVLEYFRLGSLDQYLREKRSIVKQVDLIEAAKSLATALYHLEDKGVVHGNIRCRKLLVTEHTDSAFTVKLADPGMHDGYSSKEVHWIPTECYTNLDYARKSTAADVWAFGTTLFEIFTYGSPIIHSEHSDHMDIMKFYMSGKRLPKPANCPSDIYVLMRECWNQNPHRRCRPQSIMRDVNQLFYEVYNARKIHAYAKISKNIRPVAPSMSSLSSSNTESTFVPYQEDLVTVSDMENDVSLRSNLASSNRWLSNAQDVSGSEDDRTCDFSTLMSNFDFSTTTTSLDSFNSMQSIFELDDDCNIVLQGRIGQGFYGEVYKGTLEYLGNEEVEPRMVAVKKLKANAVASCLQDFEREINIMKTLKHPNIVEILGVLEDPEISLVMEYVQHGSLQSYLKIYRENLTTKQLLNYALDIAKGMDYLGKKNVVHRDLAARNILVVDEHHVKISDFGLAQVMSTNDYYILKTNRELPIKWYAPESLRDGKFSVRSDVWSYGVTMCEMFSHGDEPKLANVNLEREEGQEQQILLKALESGTRYPCPSMCPQSVYVRIIYPCWHRDPHSRPTFSTICTETEDLLTQH